MSFDRRALMKGALAASTLPLLGSLPRPARAAAPPAAAQVPGLYRFKVGAFEVTAVNDGHLQLDLGWFPAADPARAEELLEGAFMTKEAIPTSVNTYLVNIGDRLVLIDTGTANAMGPTLGKLAANLTAAGVEPGAVDVVLLTHMHPDHVNGLLGPEGAVFPNAEVVVAEEEYGFWTDEGVLAQAPAEFKPIFEMARAAVAPYAEAGRLRQFSGAAELVPGIRSVAAPGHTPGHTLFHIASGDGELLVWGDIVHTAALQLARPDWALAFDTDQALGIESRKRVLDQVATDRTLVAGMHLAFPGVGYVARDGQAYEFVPAPWQSAL